MMQDMHFISQSPKLSSNLHKFNGNKPNIIIFTSSFLSLWKAPLRYSSDTSSFSFSHCITNGSNHLWQKDRETSENILISILNLIRNSDMINLIEQFPNDV